MEKFITAGDLVSASGKKPTSFIANGIYDGFLFCSFTFTDVRYINPWQSITLKSWFSRDDVVLMMQNRSMEENLIK